MAEHAHHQRPEAQPSDGNPSENLTAQMTKLMEQNRQLVLRLSDLETKMSNIAEQNQQLSAQLSSIAGRDIPRRRTLMRLPALDFEEDEDEHAHAAENWKLMLQLSLSRSGLDRHLEEDVPQPEDEAERAQWKADQQDIVDLMLASIRKTEVLDCIRCLGWSPKCDTPKSTYQKILDAVSGRYQGEITLIWRFQRLYQDTEGDLSLAEKYFDTLHDLYEAVARKDDADYLGPVSALRFLQGIRASCPALFDRHAPKVEAMSFTWESFFRDAAYDAMLGRFRGYPAVLRKRRADKMHEGSEEGSSPLTPAGPLQAIWLSPEAGKGFLDGKGVLEIWESWRSGSP